MVAHARVQQAEVDGLRKLMEEAMGALESTKEWGFQLKEDVITTSIHHFEEAKRRVSLLYPHMDLSFLPF